MIRTSSLLCLAAAVALGGALVVTDVPLSTTRTLLDACPDLIAYKSAGPCVTRLQVELDRRAGARLDPCGQFGDKTLAAVKAYQWERELAADGIVGDSTKQRLRLDRPTLNYPMPPLAM